MDLIQGGRTLTANVNYVLQLGKSTFSPDVKRGKITKTRGGYYEMKDIPLWFILNLILECSEKA